MLLIHYVVLHEVSLGDAVIVLESTGLDHRLYIDGMQAWVDKYQGVSMHEKSQ